MLCLRCFHLWPSGSTYCGVCRLPLNARQCPNGHSNPLGRAAQTCLTCNQGPLTGAVYGLPTTGLTRLAALLLLLLAWRWTWDHLCLVLRVVGRVGVWGLSVIFDTAPAVIVDSLTRLLTWIVVLLVLSYALPNGRGTFLRTGLRNGLRSAGKGVRWLWAQLRRLV